MGKNAILKFAFWILILAALAGFFWKLWETPQWQEIKSASALEVKSAPRPIGLFSFFSGSKKPTEPVNFLLLGETGAGYEAPDLTDTILAARFDEAKNKIFLFSLPRDLLVKIPGSNNYTKLNALYTYAKNEKNEEFKNLEQKVQEITGLEIQHYVLVDLTFVKDLVDLLGGVNVWVAKDIVDTAFPGPNHSFQTFELKSGWRYLDGETALKYICSRHSANGDFDRVSRQQEILQALKQKILNLKFWDFEKFIGIYQTLSQNTKTDLSPLEIKSWWEKIKDVPGQDIVKTDILSQNLFETGTALLGGTEASIVKPKAGVEDYGEIRKFVEEMIK